MRAFLYLVAFSTFAVHFCFWYAFGMLNSQICERVTHFACFYFLAAFLSLNSCFVRFAKMFYFLLLFFSCFCFVLVYRYVFDLVAVPS